MTYRPITFADMQARELERQAEIVRAAEERRAARTDRALAEAQREREAQEEKTRKWRAEQDRKREAVARQIDQDAAEAREKRLRELFRQRVPGGSAEDFKLLRPSLIAELANEAAAERQQMANRLGRL